MKTLRIFVATIGLLSLSASARAMGSGSSMLALQMGSTVADYIQPSGNYFTAGNFPILSANAQYWYMVADDYAVTLTGGLGFFSETDKPTDTAPAATPDQKTTISAVIVRVGGDRVAKVGERATIYFGPGLEFYSGGYKYEAGTFTEEPEKTTRISFHGRMGGTMHINDSVGLTGHIGHRWGRASAEDSGSKVTWWSSGFDGAGGIVFFFGGK